MSDLIERQDAMNVTKRLLGDSEISRTMQTALRILPSAQPETHEKRTETHACDCISRKAAIDAVYKCADIFAGDMPVMVVKADAYEAIAQLPSAQPDLEEDEDIPMEYFENGGI